MFNWLSSLNQPPEDEKIKAHAAFCQREGRMQQGIASRDNRMDILNGTIEKLEEENKKLRESLESTFKSVELACSVEPAFEKEVVRLKEENKKFREALKEILKEQEWSRETIRNRETFGLPEEVAVYRRESRARGVHLTTSRRIRQALKEEE